MTAPFKKDDIVEGTWRTRRGDAVKRIRITWVERREEGWYFGYVDAPGARYTCGFGAAMVFDEAKPFGLVAFRVLPPGGDAS